jgi:hypothetical protein
VLSQVLAAESTLGYEDVANVQARRAPRAARGGSDCGVGFGASERVPRGGWVGV